MISYDLAFANLRQPSALFDSLHFPRGAGTRRPRSYGASLSDEGTDTGRPGKRQRRPMSDEDASTTSVPQFAGSEEGGGGGSLTEGGQQPLPSAPQPPPRETVVSRDHGRS